jgi:crossover junction endodeoxyribonuclease RuvC
MGLDLGSRSTGLCVLQGSVNEPKLFLERTFHAKHRDLGERLLEMATQISDVLTQVSPAWVSLETPFYGIDVKSLSVLSEVRGAVLMELARRGVPREDVSPAETKMAIAGHGRAEKDQVARMMCALLGVEHFSSEDASDAAAVAFAGWVKRQSRMNLALAGGG